MKTSSRLLYSLVCTTLVFGGCRKDRPVEPEAELEEPVQEVIYTGFPETFEAGSKDTYAAADITLGSGTWNLADALIGTSTNDRKNGAKSVRIQNSGRVTMKFNVNEGASSVTVSYGSYGSDSSSTFEVWQSRNYGNSWTQVGGAVTASSTTLATVSFPLSITGIVRFQVRKTSGGRLNIDDFDVVDNSSTPTRDDNLALGNPSGATTNAAFPNNYLLVKSQFALAYNSSRGTPSWVSWHLSTAWKGSAPRCDCFSTDISLPTGFFRAQTTNYTNTGFDRGHMTPSEDRDLTDADNAATFKMTNIMPQAPNLNQQTWAALETYTRILMNQGNELYVIAGGYGSGGTGGLGGATTSIASGNITVPSRYWKVIVVLPTGSNDLARVSTSTRVIAVDMPNVQTVNQQAWGSYRTSVDAIEAATGLDLLSLVDGNVQTTIEALVDNGATQ